MAVPHPCIDRHRPLSLHATAVTMILLYATVAPRRRALTSSKITNNPYIFRGGYEGSSGARSIQHTAQHNRCFSRTPGTNSSATGQRNCASPTKIPAPSLGNRRSLIQCAGPWTKPGPAALRTFLTAPSRHAHGNRTYHAYSKAPAMPARRGPCSPCSPCAPHHAMSSLAVCRRRFAIGVHMAAVVMVSGGRAG